MVSDIPDLYEMLDIKTCTDTDYESLQTSDDELPEPTEPGPISYENERMYILSTLKYLSIKMKQLSNDINDLLHRK